MAVVNAMKPCWCWIPNQMRKSNLSAHMEGRWNSFRILYSPEGQPLIAYTNIPNDREIAWFWMKRQIPQQPLWPNKSGNVEAKKTFYAWNNFSIQIVFSVFSLFFCLNSFFWCWWWKFIIWENHIFHKKKKYDKRMVCRAEGDEDDEESQKNKSVEDRCYHSTQLIGSLVRYKPV